MKVPSLTLRAWRINSGLTVDEVAQKTGLKAKRIIVLETNSSRVTMREAMTLAMLYKVPHFDYVWFGKESEYHERWKIAEYESPEALIAERQAVGRM